MKQKDTKVSCTLWYSSSNQPDKSKTSSKLSGLSDSHSRSQDDNSFSIYQNGVVNKTQK